MVLGGEFLVVQVLSAIDHNVVLRVRKVVGDIEGSVAKLGAYFLNLVDITDYIDHVVEAFASGDEVDGLSHGIGCFWGVDDALRGVSRSLHIDDIGGITSIKFVGLFASGRDSSGTYAYYFYVAIRINGGHVRVRTSISDGQIVRVVEGYEIYRVAQRDVVLLAAVGDACGLQNYGTCLVVHDL